MPPRKRKTHERRPMTEAQKKAMPPGDALAPGYVRIRSEVNRLVDIPAADLQDMLTQYPGVKVVAGANAGAYATIRKILEDYDPEQLRDALDRLEQEVPEWVSADFMASKIIEQGGLGLLESMFPDGGSGMVFDTTEELEEAV